MQLTYAKSYATQARSRRRTPWPATGRRAFLLFEAATFVVASLIHGGLLIDGYEHHEAHLAEAVIATVLLIAILVATIRPAWTRAAGLGGQGFALLGTLVGLFTIAVGVGPRTVPDVVYHVAIVIVLVRGIHRRTPGPRDRVGGVQVCPFGIEWRYPIRGAAGRDAIPLQRGGSFVSSSRFVMVLLLVAGCGSGGFHGEFVEACNESGEGSEGFCECMADAADENLNDEQKEYVLAGVRGDEARASELQAEMGMEGAEEVGAFMAGAFACGAEEAETQGM